MSELISPSPEEMGTKEVTEQVNPAVKHRDIYREHASELQRSVAEVQGARYETALIRLMERSGDNTELVNAMNELTIALEWAGAFGEQDRQLPQQRVEFIANVIRQAAETINSRP